MREGERALDTRHREIPAQRVVLDPAGFASKRWVASASELTAQAAFDPPRPVDNAIGSGSAAKSNIE
jgi:hypothetical protein